MVICTGDRQQMQSGVRLRQAFHLVAYAGPILALTPDHQHRGISRSHDLFHQIHFDEVPSLQDQDYFLAKGKDGVYRLLSTRCPHRWGEIIEWDTCFMCPDHGWRFEMSGGVCINGPYARVEAIPVTLRDGRLIAQLPPEQSSS